MTAKKPTKPDPKTRSLLDAVREVTPKNGLDALDKQTREQVIEVAKAFVAGEIRVSRLQILATLKAQGVTIGRYTFDRLLESVRAGAVR